LLKGVVGGLPASGGGVDGWILFEVVEDEVAAVAAAGGADLPVAGRHVGREGGAVEDGLALAEVFEEGQQAGVGVSGGLRRGHEPL